MVEKMSFKSEFSDVVFLEESDQDLKPLLSQDIKKEHFLDVNKRAVVKELPSANSELFVLELMSGEKTFAYKAVGCLHELAVGDRVMLNLAPGDCNYITLLLSKGAGNDENLDFQRIQTINARQIKLDTNSFVLKSEKSLFSGTTLQFKQQQIVSQSISYSLLAREVCTSAVKVELNAKRSKQTLQRSDKTILGYDRVRAFNIDYSAKTSARVNAETTILNGKNLLKMDGKLIMAG